LPRGFLDDGQFEIVSGKAAGGVLAGEERDRGDHDLAVIVSAKQAGSAKAADCAQVLVDLSFVMTLIVTGGGQRRPSTPLLAITCPPRRPRRSDIPDGTVMYRDMGGSEHPADAGICRGPCDWAAARPAMALCSRAPAACLAIGLSCEPATHVRRRLM